MAKQIGFTPGGDAQAIQETALKYYGSYAKMFEAHGWPERGRQMLTSVQARVVEAYGSVKAFEETHMSSNDLMFPMEAIYGNPTNVWLTSFYGFRPETWGFVGFTGNGLRTNFLRKTKPGVLVVIYGAGKAPDDMLGRVVGVLQCSHEIGDAESFLAPAEWTKKQADPDRRDRWNYAVRVTRAWRVTPDSRSLVRDFAPEATASEAWQHIGALGKLLSRQEALKILKLELQETDVYRQLRVDWSEPGSALEILAPTRAGPVSQRPHVVREAEGPKHLYILRLRGDADVFLGESCRGQQIIKVGMSGNPDRRCEDHNRHLPKGAYKWEVLRSGPLSGLDPYPTSKHALAGEHAIQRHLCSVWKARSLEHEFFLASHEAVEKSWLVGNDAAAKFEK